MFSKAKYSCCFLEQFLENQAKLKESFANTYKELVKFFNTKLFNVEIIEYIEERITEIYTKVYNH